MQRSFNRHQLRIAHSRRGAALLTAMFVMVVTSMLVLMICDTRLIDKPYGRRIWQSLPPMKRTRDRDEVLRAMEATGLKCASVCGIHHWSEPLTHPSENVRKEGLDALLHTLKDAKAYDCGSILLVPGVCTDSIPYDVAMERAFTEISKAVPLAEELKVRISIENVWNNMFLSPVEAAQFVDRFKSAYVGWHFDIGNMLRRHQRKARHQRGRDRIIAGGENA